MSGKEVRTKDIHNSWKNIGGKAFSRTSFELRRAFVFPCLSGIFTFEIDEGIDEESRRKTLQN